MTYRGSYPPGQGYNGQQPLPRPEFSQYGNGYTHGNSQFQNPQFPPTVYPQQPATHVYPPTTTTSQFQPYDNHYARPPPPPAPTEPPVQFVDPSFLQQTPIYRPPPPLVPAAPPVTYNPPPSNPPNHTAPAKESPRPEYARPPSQDSHSNSVTTIDPRKLSSTAGVTRSPSISQPPAQVETLPLLVCIAEDCFSNARASVRYVGRNMDDNAVNEYHKLVATGLGCLEMALQSNKIKPQLEARLRLQYANILIEETNNTMEAETALNKGIAHCDKHRFMDLKYCMQFLFAKVLFQRNPKAALISIDTNISESTTYKQAHWVYVFRFLKASFYLQTGAAADPHALENLKKLAAMANQRGDKAICVMASLLEGLAHLSNPKDDVVTRVQTCLAQASKFQLETSVHVPQIDCLLLLMDLGCSLLQKLPALYSQKLKALQTHMDKLKNSTEWQWDTTEVLLPIRKQSGTSSTISDVTRSILRQGDGDSDYLVLPAISKQQAFALSYTFHGMVALKNSTTIGRSSDIWDQALKILNDRASQPTALSLPAATKQAAWEAKLTCYVSLLIGLQSATLSEWAKVKKCLRSAASTQCSSDVLDILQLYLAGVYAQGTANLDEALRLFQDPRLNIESEERKPGPGNIVYELCILAAVNRIWIMQAPSNRDDAKTMELVELLRPLCTENDDMEIRTAYNLILASIQTNPPLSINQVKRHIQQSLSGAQQSSNTQCLSIALNIMRCRLFENVVGEQALKSARAGSAQAKKVGNLLWMSVAEGMLAQSFEMQGAASEARETRERGIHLANEALAKTQT